MESTKGFEPINNEKSALAEYHNPSSLDSNPGSQNNFVIKKYKDAISDYSFLKPEARAYLYFPNSKMN